MRWLYFLGILLVLVGCREELSEVNPAPPQVAWEQENYILTFQDSLFLRLIFNKEWREEYGKIQFSVKGALIDEEALNPIPSSVRPKPGSTSFKIGMALNEANEEFNGLEAQIQILEDSSYMPVIQREQTTVTVGAGHDIDMDLWAPQEEFARLWGFDNVPDQETGPANGRHFAFVHRDPIKPNVVGLYNTDSTRSTNIFNMHRIYADQDVQSASARLRMEEALLFIPYDENNPREGTVKVIEQNIRVHRKSSTNLPPFFYIGIKGEGTYSEITETIDLEVVFDESDIGGETEVVYYFRLQPEDN